MMLKKETEVGSICPASRHEWRLWLKENHSSKQAVWLIYYKKETGRPTITWSEAVDEALCFGWIDSTKKTLDTEMFMQFFCKRKPKSGWSKINKGKILQLVEEGLMMPAGYKCIETAKQNGSWAILDEIEELKMPIDLERELATKAGAMDFFLSLSKSVKKSILHWIVTAKKEETRQKRINEVVELAAQQLKPKQFR